MYNHPDETVTEADDAAAFLQDTSILKMRVEAADATYGSARSKKEETTSTRGLLRLLTYAPQAGLTACVVGFAWVAGSHFSGEQASPQPAKTIEVQESVERAELLRVTQKMAGEIRTLQAGVGAMHAMRSQNAKDAAAIENLKRRLDAVKTETGAALAEVEGKVEQLQHEAAAKASEVRERFNRLENLIAAPRAAPPRTVVSASEGDRAQRQPIKRHRDAFDPSKNPGAPGVPRPLGSPAK